MTADDRFSETIIAEIASGATPAVVSVPETIDVVAVAGASAVVAVAGAAHWAASSVDDGAAEARVIAIHAPVLSGTLITKRPRMEFVAFTSAAVAVALIVGRAERLRAVAGWTRPTVVAVASASDVGAIAVDSA